jgi:hypothetical protein
MLLTTLIEYKNRQAVEVAKVNYHGKEIGDQGNNEKLIFQKRGKCLEYFRNSGKMHTLVIIRQCQHNLDNFYYSNIVCK